MPSLYFHKQASTSTVQPSVFASSDPPERFVIDGQGRLLRSVASSSSSDRTITSVVGAAAGVGSGDLRQAADLVWLQCKERPIADGGTAVRVADLFSGCGAMSLGLFEACRALGLVSEPAATYDIDNHALGVFASTFGIPQPQPSDLGAVLSPDLESRPSPEERELTRQAGLVDFVLAGPPCQGHSTLNNKTRHADPKNALYFLVARYAQLLQPRWVLIENVPTVRSDRTGVVQRTAEALESLGYWVVEGVVDLWAIGVPQTRRRHVLIARAEALGHLLPVNDLLVAYRTRARSVGWAIEDLLDIKPKDRADELKTPDPVTQARIDYLFDNNLYDLPDHMRPDCHRKKSHTYPSVYGRMNWHEPAPTITSGFDTMGQGRFVHPRRRRTITAHEAARLQGIPDFMRFDAVEERTRLSRLIGNAVPPKLSYVLGLELMR